MDSHGLFGASEDRATGSIPAPKRRLLTRVVLPVVILLMMCGLLAYAARNALWPARGVQAVRVVAKPGEHSDDGPSAAGASTVLVQAAGWVEPDPYPIFVTALTNGVIEKLLVLEGESVEAGQIIAEMIDDDALLAVARAEAEFNRRAALLTAAQTDWDNPVALERAVAVNNALLAEARAELGQLDATIAQKRARQKELQASYDRVSKLQPKAIAPLQVEQTQFQLEAQIALVESTEKQRHVLEAKVDQFVAEVKAAEADLRLRVDQRRAVDEAEAAMSDAKAALDEARLWLDRTKVVSPVSGVVINRMVAPGSKVMFDMDSQHSAHVAHLYDPKQLQVRVDVPLSDAAQVGVGQPARVIVEVLPETEFVGRVTRLVHEADISKNTIEVKVAIENPSSLLKPDMLTRVKFLAVDASHTDGSSVSSLMVYAPVAAVRGAGEDAAAWVVTAGGSRLRRQSIQLGPPRGDDWIAVRHGLQPGDVLVMNPTADLREGQRVEITTEVESAWKN